MGRTIPSFRLALEQEILSWGDYRSALGSDTRAHLDRAFDEARRYCSAASNVTRPVRFEGMFMALVFAHERRLEDIARKIEMARLEINGT